MLNILVTGASGQLGLELQEKAKEFGKYKFYFKSHNEIDITNLELLRNFVLDKNINIIINCAAYTAVDNAEDEKEKAFLINQNGVENLANIAKKHNIKLIHISTDYVFDGRNNTPYIPSDKTNPQGIYGASKLAGENQILKINPKNSIIIRVSWLYGFYGKNFVKTMLDLADKKDSLGVVYDQVGSPTYTGDLASAILNILPNILCDDVQIYHFANTGVTSWYDLAKAIMKIAKKDCKINPIRSYEYPTKAIRPAYSVLDSSKFRIDFAISIPYWRDSLEKCIERLNEK